MNSFETQYYTILRRQVLEEIQYLELNGHAFTPVLEPCMFCARAANGDYLCARIRQLKDFLKSIESQKGRPHFKTTSLANTIQSANLPVMFPGF